MTPDLTAQRAGRLDQVDGLRSLAILWVALYHYAVFWAPSGKGLAVLPYGDALARIPLAEVGFLGVYLFFIVSGFVIAYSLTRSPGPGHFALLRMIRLWPTLLICGTLTFALTTALGPEPLRRAPLEYLISLTFVPPAHVGKLIGMDDLEWLDGAYWSLWTEVRFYVLAALLHFSARKHFLAVWTVFALGSAGLHLLALTHGGWADAVSRLLFAAHQPYFSAGIALAALRAGTMRRAATGLLAFAGGQALVYPSLLQGSLPPTEAVGIVAVFALAIWATQARDALPLLSARYVVLAGQASYAYYLLHQNAGLALLGALATGHRIADIAIMLAIQAGLLIAAITLTRFVEAPLRHALRRRVTASRA